MEVFTTDQESQWHDVLGHMKAFDFYHLPSYHKLAEMHGEGVAELFVYREEEYVIAIPLILRSISAISGLEQVEKGLNDATSVYGYSGPISSHENVPGSVLNNFRESLKQKLLSKNIVSLFTRLHPLLNQKQLLTGLGSIVNNGKTVSIDLSQPEETQLAQYRKDHRAGIRKLRDIGATCEIDPDLTHLDSFIELYSRNMERVGAKAEYFFPRSYYEKLLNTSDATATLFICSIQGEIASSSIILRCGPIIQYHLSATSEKYLKNAPIKLLLDTVRHWGSEQGATTLHLGGGLGSNEDALFLFKAGFSHIRHDFLTWRWILLENEYNALTLRKSMSDETINDGFFPAYRK